MQRSWSPESTQTKVIVLIATTAATIAVHYGALESVLGHAHWVHAIHGRLCYIPIVIAAAWFGLRGGVVMASAITLTVLPFVLRSIDDPHTLASETAEIVFYYAIAILIGLLVERELNARRLQQEAELRTERANRLSIVGQIAAGVAHEVKNPLASIKGAADILSNDNTSRADRDEFRQILHNEVKRIDGTITEFLEFARPKEIHIEKIDFTKVLTATVRQMETHASKEGVSIASKAEENALVDGDAEKLHQMVLNLLLNAIEASQAQDVVTVTLTRSNGRGLLEISDTGVGIDKDNLEHIFEPFYTTRADGTGLGLAVVKDVVDAHAATIEITSERGHGTTVAIAFPRSRL